MFVISAGITVRNARIWWVSVLVVKVWKEEMMLLSVAVRMDILIILLILIAKLANLLVKTVKVLMIFAWIVYLTTIFRIILVWNVNISAKNVKLLLIIVQNARDQIDRMSTQHVCVIKDTLMMGFKKIVCSVT